MPSISYGISPDTTMSGVIQNWYSRGWLVNPVKCIDTARSRGNSCGASWPLPLRFLKGTMLPVAVAFVKDKVLLEASGT